MPLLGCEEEVVHSHYAWRPRFDSEPLFNPFRASPDRIPHPEETRIEFLDERIEPEPVGSASIELAPIKPGDGPQEAR